MSTLVGKCLLQACHCNMLCPLQEKRLSLLSCAYILYNLYTWQLMHSEQAYTKSLVLFLVSKRFISHDETTP